MTVAELLRAAIPVSLALIVLGLGMGCSVADATSLFRRPWLLVRSVLAMNLVMPLVAVGVAAATALPVPVKVALLTLSVSPVPPILPSNQLRLVAQSGYVYGLLVATAVFSIVLVPATMLAITRMVGHRGSVDPLIVARAILVSVLLPLAAGMALRCWRPALAATLGRVLGLIGWALVAAALAGLLAVNWHALGLLIGDGTLLAYFGIALAGLAVGHCFGGPREDDRTVLALACASRHPGIAIAVGAALFPGQALIGVAVVLFLIVTTVTAVPYHLWRRRLHAARSAPVA